MGSMTPQGWGGFWLKAAGLTLLSVLAAVYMARLCYALTVLAVRQLAPALSDVVEQFALPCLAIFALLNGLVLARIAGPEVRDDLALVRSSNRPQRVLKEI